SVLNQYAKCYMKEAEEKFKELHGEPRFIGKDGKKKAQQEHARIRGLDTAERIRSSPPHPSPGWLMAICRGQPNISVAGPVSGEELHTVVSSRGHCRKSTRKLIARMEVDRKMSDMLEGAEVARLIERDQKAMDTHDPNALAKFQREILTINTLADNNPGFARAIYDNLDKGTQEKCRVEKFDDGSGREYLVFPDAFQVSSSVINPEAMVDDSVSDTIPSPSDKTPASVSNRDNASAGSLEAVAGALG